MTDSEAQLIRKAVAATLRTVAYWGEMSRDGFRDIASQVVDQDVADWMCCPVCEETVCDEDCPLAPVRAFDVAP